MTNFDFLKKIDEELYKISCEAEKLYRDEYFSQCIAQTRKFGETACKKLLGERLEPASTFEDMINILKDDFAKTQEEKEFIEDLYFIKKEGNYAVHGVVLQRDGMKALECLRRTFEIAINFSIFKNGQNSKISLLRYDEELLILGKRSQDTLQEKYLEKKRELEREYIVKEKKISNSSLKPKKEQKAAKSERTKKTKSFSVQKAINYVYGIIVFIIITALYIYIKFIL